MSKPAASKDSDVLQLLDSLDDIPGAPVAASKTNNAGSRSGTPTATNGEAAEALAFLDELTQQSSRPTRVLTPGPRVRNPTVDSVRRSIDAARRSANASPVPNNTGAPAASSTNATATAAETSPEGKSWGWTSVWSTASAAIAQAKSVVDEGVKQLPNEQAKKWGEGMMEYVKNAQLEKIGSDIRAVGMSTLTDIINAVAPPIAEHEVIQIWLSHDMKGYDGVESLVYRAMARIMEQVEGGDLVVNSGKESKPKSDDGTRDLGAIDGVEAAMKLAAAEIEALSTSDQIQKTQSTQSNATKSTNPTTYSTILLRIQPFLTPLLSCANDSNNAPSPPPPPQQQLQFLLYLVDPAHAISHTTTTQAVPASWLPIWDDYEWVEDLVVDSLRVGVEVLGEQYLVSRMGWGKKSVLPSVTENDPEKVSTTEGQ